MKAHTRRGHTRQFVSQNCIQRDVCGFHSHLKPTASGEILTPILDMLITKEIN
jgi:hypothetical protein